MTWCFAFDQVGSPSVGQAQRLARFYGLVRLVLDLVVLRSRSERSKDSRFSCCATSSRFLNAGSRVREPDDRILLTAFARALDRNRWSTFLVQPDTILRSHRRLIATH